MKEIARDKGMELKIFKKITQDRVQYKKWTYTKRQQRKGKVKK